MKAPPHFIFNMKRFTFLLVPLILFIFISQQIDYEKYFSIILILLSLMLLLSIAFLLYRDASQNYAL